MARVGEQLSLLCKFDDASEIHYRDAVTDVGHHREIMRGLSEANGSWKTICIERRCGRSSVLPRWVMSRPLRRMLPLVGSTSRRMLRATVDLPQPDSPTSPSVSPMPSVKLTPSTACT